MSQIGLFIAGNVLFATGLIVHAFLYNFYLEALGFSPQVMGHAVSFLTGGSLATLIPAGLTADRAGSRLTVLVGTVVLTAGLVCGALATAPGAVWGAAALAGAGSAFWRVAMAPVLMRVTTPNNRARAFAWNVGLLSGWNAAGVAIAGAVSAWLQAHRGLPPLAALRATLLLGAAGSAASFLLYIRLPLSGDTRAPGGKAVMPSASPRNDARPVRALAPLIGLLGVWLTGPALATQFLNLFFAHVHHLSVERIGFLFAAAGLGWAVAVLASGELVSAVGVAPLLFAAMVAFAPAIWGLSFAASVGLAVALYFCQGFIAPLTTPLIDQWLLGQAAPEHQGMVSSWRQVAADVSAMIGASVGGWILTAGSFHTLFLVAGVVGLVGALGVIAAARPRVTRPQGAGASGAP